MATTPIDIQGISRVDTKQTDLTASQYDGQARPGELVVDLSTYALYVANLRGNLNPVIAPPTQMSNVGNGDSGVFIPVANGNVLVNVGANANVAVYSGDTVTYQANLIPNVDSVYSIGNATNQWKDLWVSGTTIYVGGVPLSSNATSNTLSVAGNTVLTENPSGTTAANNFVANTAVVTGNVTVNDTVSTSNLVVTGTSNLGNIANVHIAGGTTDQVLVTDGTGNLSFKTFTSIANGTSNVTVPTANGNVDVYVAGSKITTVDTGGLTVTGNATIISNLTVGANVGATNFNTPGNVITGKLVVTGTTSLGNAGNITITGGTIGQVLTTNGSGGLSWSTVGGAGANGTYISNGTSSVSVPTANGNVQVISNATTVMQIGKTLTTFLTDVSAGNIVAANITGTGQNVVINTSGYLTTFDNTGNATFPGNVAISNALSVTGVSNLGAVGNVRITGGTNGQVLGTNGAGGLSWVSLVSGSLANGTSNITIPIAGANITMVSGGNVIANVTGTALDVANLAANAMTVRGVSNLGPASNLRISGGAINQVLTSTGVGTVVWSNVTVTGVSSISNGSTSATISTFDGPLIMTSSQGVVANISDQFYVTGNMVLASNLVVQRNSYLGSNANVKITGGTNGQVLVTDGVGGLTWVTLSGVGQPANIANGTTSVNTFSSNSTVSVITGGTTQMNFVSGNIQVLAANTTYFGNVIIDNTVAIANLGNVSNLRISGGTSGQFLQTNGSGGLSWSTAAVTTVANGTSNVNIPVASGNVNISVAAAANVVAVTATGANITGTANITGVTSTATVQESAIALGAGSAINVSLGAVFTKTITTVTTFSVTSVPASGKVGSFILELTNGGAFGVTWWAGVKWASGSTPTLTTSGRDVLAFYTYDGGTIWNGLILGKDMK